MSKSLRDTIVREVRKRETERLKRQEEYDKKIEKCYEEGDTESILLYYFKKELNRCIENHEHYGGHLVPMNRLNALKNYEDVANELGFYVQSSENLSKKFSVKKSNGEITTIAQDMVNELETTLVYIQNDIKSELVEECKRVLGEIRKGHYEVDKEYFSKIIRIHVVSNVSFTKSSIEDKIVYNYFKKYKHFHFLESYGDKWCFQLYED